MTGFFSHRVLVKKTFGQGIKWVKKVLKMFIAVIITILGQPSRLTFFSFLQLDGLSRVANGVLGKANKLSAKIPLSDFFQEDNMFNDFFLECGFNTRKERKIPYLLSTIN
jgi:hypothetical protein